MTHQTISLTNDMNRPNVHAKAWSYEANTAKAW